MVQGGATSPAPTVEGRRLAVEVVEAAAWERWQRRLRDWKMRARGEGEDELCDYKIVCWSVGGVCSSVVDKERELDVLGMMPELCFLHVYFRDLGRWTIPDGGSFPKLRHAMLEGITPTFLPGAMPMLTKLQLKICLVFFSGMKNGAGLGNLSRLNHVDIKINCFLHPNERREAVKVWSALTREIKEHPTSTASKEVQFIPVAPSVSSTCSFFLTFRYFHSNVKYIFQNDYYTIRDDEEETSNGAEEVPALQN
jgi:hypothetical protein